MATPAQTLANKNNAQQSTGPKTRDGKSRSRLNALRHGLTGSTVVLPSECVEAYRKFSQMLLANLAPIGQAEEFLAQTYIDTQWRLNRISALEANLFALARLEPVPERFASIEDPRVLSALLEANALCIYDRQFRNLHLQENRLRRLLEKTANDLVALQDARESPEQPTQTLNQPAIGFEFSVLPSASRVPSARPEIHPNPALKHTPPPAHSRHAQPTS